MYSLVAGSGSVFLIRWIVARRCACALHVHTTRACDEDGASAKNRKDFIFGHKKT